MIHCELERVRFGFHNFRHSLATALVKLKVDPKDRAGMFCVTRTSARRWNSMHSPTWTPCGMRKASSWNSSWETEFTCSQSEFSENHGLDRGLEISALRR